MSLSPPSLPKQRKLHAGVNFWGSLTSSPFRSTRNDEAPSPSLSSISSLISTGMSEATQPSSNSLDNEMESSGISVEDHNLAYYEKFLSSVKSSELKGPKWELYQPIDDPEKTPTLYGVLLQNVGKTPQLAAWFITHCKNHGIAAVYDFYKLVFDCAGYQNFKLKEHYSFPPKPKDLIQLAGDLAKKGKLFEKPLNLFGDNSDVAVIIKNVIYNFIIIVLLSAHDQNILDWDIFKWVLELLVEMTKSSIKQFVYTSWMLNLKFLTAISLAMSKAKTTDQKFILNTYTNQIYFSFISLLPRLSNTEFGLKVSFVNELKLWIYESPNIYIHHFECLNSIKELIRTDISKKVRLAVLKMLKTIMNKKLISYGNFTDAQNLRKEIQSLQNRIFERFYDTKDSVAISALETYHSLISNYSEYAAMDVHFDTLMLIIYHKDALRSTLACKCISHMMKYEGMNTYEYLLGFCKIDQKHENKTALLVEACLVNVKNELKNWNLIVNMLTDPTVEVALKRNLSHIFFEIVKQCLDGKSSKDRKNSPINEPDETISEDVANSICSYLKELDTSSRAEPLILAYVLDILLNINPQHLQNCYDDIASFLKEQFMDAFNYYKNPNTLSNLLEFLLHVDCHMPDLHETITIFVDDLKKNYSQQLRNTRDSEWISLKKLAIIFSKIDMNDSIAWSEIPSIPSEELSLEILDAVLHLYHWSLMWKIEKISTVLSTDEREREILLLMEKYEQYMNQNINILEDVSLGKKIKGFENICQTNIDLSQRKAKFDNQKLSISVANSTKIVQTFDSLIKEDRVTDDQKHKFAMYIINMSLIQLFPMENTAYVVKYYYQYYEQFNSIVQKLFKIIFDSGIEWTPLIIVNAMRLLFEHDLVHLSTKENVKEIIRLCKSLVEDSLVNSKSAEKIIIYGINYVIKYGKYAFLTTFQPFIDMLRNEIKSKILSHINQHEHRLDFTDICMLSFKDNLNKN